MKDRNRNLCILLVLCALILSHSVARGDIWTGTTSYTHDYSIHKKKIKAQLYRQMSAQLKFFIESNRSAPQIEEFARNGNMVIFEALESEIDRNLLILSKYSLQLNGTTSAAPEKKLYGLSNPVLESPQEVGGGDKSIDLEVQGIPLGKDLVSGLKLLIKNPAFLNGKETSAVDSDVVKIQGKAEAEFTITLTLGFPEVSGVDFDLRVISAKFLEEIPTSGKSMVIVALVDSKLHIRIFDEMGTMVVEKGENDLGEGMNLITLKSLFDSSRPEFHPKLSITDELIFLKRAIAVSSPLIIKLKGRATAPVNDNITLQVSSD